MASVRSKTLQAGGAKREAVAVPRLPRDIPSDLYNPREALNALEAANPAMLHENAAKVLVGYSQAALPLKVYKCSEMSQIEKDDKGAWKKDAEGNVVAQKFAAYKKRDEKMEKATGLFVQDAQGHFCYPEGTEGEVVNEDEEKKANILSGTPAEQLRKFIREGTARLAPASGTAKVFKESMEDYAHGEEIKAAMKKEKEEKEEKEREKQIKKEYEHIEKLLKADKKYNPAAHAAEYAAAFPSDKDLASLTDLQKAARLFWHRADQCTRVPEIAACKDGDANLVDKSTGESEGAASSIKCKAVKQPGAPAVCVPTMLDKKKDPLADWWKQFALKAKRELAVKQRENYDMVSPYAQGSYVPAMAAGKHHEESSSSDDE